MLFLLTLTAAFIISGSVLVDWLISNRFAASRLEAVTLASVLVDENFIKPMGARSVEAMRNGDLTEQFLDDSTALYTFVSDEISGSLLSAYEDTKKWGAQCAYALGRLIGKICSKCKSGKCKSGQKITWAKSF